MNFWVPILQNVLVLNKGGVIFLEKKLKIIFWLSFECEKNNQTETGKQLSLLFSAISNIWKENHPLMSVFSFTCQLYEIMNLKSLKIFMTNV